MSKDVLVKWATLIATTAGWVSEHDEADAKSDRIQELAAALRAVQKRAVGLEEHSDLIARAESGYIGLDYVSEGRVADCIADLAAALQAERERVKTYIICNEGNVAEIALLRERVAELDREARRLRNVHEYVVVELAARERTLTVVKDMLTRANSECDALQARVAEVEECLPKDDEFTWYCPKCHRGTSMDDDFCLCGYDKGVTP